MSMGIEERLYEVHPRQLAWAMHELNGIPDHRVQGYYQLDNGMMIIAVLVPAGTAQRGWRETPTTQKRRSRFDFDLRVVVKWMCVLAIVGGLAYVGYGLLAPAQAAPTQAAPEPSLWDSIANMLPQLQGEPVVERTDEGFRWPWDAAADAAADTAAVVAQIVTALVLMFVLGAIGFAVIKMRGMRK